MAFRGSKRERGKRFHPHELVFLQKWGASPQWRHHTQKALIKKEELNDGLRKKEKWSKGDQDNTSP